MCFAMKQSAIDKNMGGTASSATRPSRNFFCKFRDPRLCVPRSPWVYPFGNSELLYFFSLAAHDILHLLCQLLFRLPGYAIILEISTLENKKPGAEYHVMIFGNPAVSVRPCRLSAPPSRDGLVLSCIIDTLFSFVLLLHLSSIWSVTPVTKFHLFNSTPAQQFLLYH